MGLLLGTERGEAHSGRQLFLTPGSRGPCLLLPATCSALPLLLPGASLSLSPCPLLPLWECPKGLVPGLETERKLSRRAGDLGCPVVCCLMGREASHSRPLVSV